MSADGDRVPARWQRVHTRGLGPGPVPGRGYGHDKIGTAEGLYAAGAPSGSLVATDLPGQDVTALAVDPAHPERW
jgi:hypothetical protein